MHCIRTPQTLRIQGYKKIEKVTMLIDYGSTHNFINWKLATLLNGFVYPIPAFKAMIAYAGSINYSWKFSINITIREYLFYNPMISIQMGGVDVVLGV